MTDNFGFTAVCPENVAMKFYFDRAGDKQSNKLEDNILSADVMISKGYPVDFSVNIDIDNKNKATIDRMRIVMFSMSSASASAKIKAVRMFEKKIYRNNIFTKALSRFGV